MPDQLEKALELAKRGIYTFPSRVSLKPDSKKDVRPIDHWNQVSTIDENTIRGWWGAGREWEGAAVCIDTGKSGLVVVDCDIRPGVDGIAEWKRLCVEHGIPISPGRVITPSGGQHWYYRADPDRPIGNNATGKVGPAIDIRALGGFTFAPGSEHEGGAWRWMEGVPEFGDLPVVPDIVIDRMSARATSTPAGPPESELFGMPARAFTRDQAIAFCKPAMDELYAVQRGQVNATLNTAAKTLSHFAPAFWSRAEVEAMLERALAHLFPGGLNHEDHATIASAFASATSDWRAEAEPDPFAGGAQEGAEAGVDPVEREIRAELHKLRVRGEAKRRHDEEQRAEHVLPAPASTGLADLLNEVDEEVEHRIEGLWPTGGNVILSAARKTGKTTLVANVIRCLVDGGELLAIDPFAPAGQPSFTATRLTADGTVMLVDLEMSRRQMRRWLREQKIESVERVNVVDLRGRLDEFNVLDPARLAAWAEHLRGLSTRVLIIDPLGPLLDAAGVEENDNSGVSRVLGALDTLKTQAGVGELLIAHHFGHNGERSRGASRLRGWPDAEWRLLRAKTAPGEEPAPDGPRFFAAEGRDVSVPETQLSYDRAARRLSLSGGGGRSSAAAVKAEGPVCDLVALDPGASGRDLERSGHERGIGRDAVREALRTLRASGRVHTCPAGGNAMRHVISDGCDTPSDCPAARASRMD